MGGDRFYSFRNLPLSDTSLPLSSSGASTEMELFAVCFLGPNHSAALQGQRLTELPGMVKERARDLPYSQGDRRVSFLHCQPAAGARSSGSALPGLADP